VKYPVAEKFISVQGEGLYTGTPMAFIRLVGCSVGQKVCTACDTDFDKTYPKLGGGVFEVEELVKWARAVPIINITGGEPLDRLLKPLVDAAHEEGLRVHVETSGTVQYEGHRHGSINWITVSPKPGYLSTMIGLASELKVILGGLGEGEGWPTLEQAIGWAQNDHLVYLQPRNHKNQIDDHNMQEAIALVLKHPELRLSTQFHKYVFAR
jgi:7-carboxy-7-deazaguanine synthase